MKISVNAITDFNNHYKSSGNPAPYGIPALVDKIGAQLGAVEETIAAGKKFEGVLIVKVVSCRQHPNADRLNVCMIDDGAAAKNVARDSNGLVQVVCGAINVRAGITAAWLPPGAIVPSTYDSDPFVLESRELRGVVSNGMLASPKELTLGDSHEGILLIDGQVAPGTSFADKYGLAGDTVIDIENKMFTHRPDCFGMMGVAREIAGIQGHKFTSPDWYRSDALVPRAGTDSMTVTVRNEIPGLVPRFMAVPMSNVSVKPSPVWLQVELSRLGLRPINNIVDLTNYYMLLTGQPLHAYDYDKVSSQGADAAGAGHATLVVRHPVKGEKLTLLNGKEIIPRDQAILIATENKPIGLGGVMGGADTEVDAGTSRIILECANFDMYSIRRTSMAHGIFSDAVTRFNKGQSPLQNRAVLAKIVVDVQRLCGGRVDGKLVDDNHLPNDITSRNSLYPDVTVSSDFINMRLGLRLTPGRMANILTNVEFAVEVNGDQLTVRAPFWRTDIEIPEDIVEEIGRLYGFDKLPLELAKRSLKPVPKDVTLLAKSQVRAALSRAGANEAMTYSFVNENLLEKAGQDKKLAFKLSNALSPDLQCYRLSLTPSLLDKIHANVKAGYDEFAIFELGKVHGNTDIDADGLPLEFGRLSLVYVSAGKEVSGESGAPYYQSLEYLRSVLPGVSAGYRLQPLLGFDYGGHALFEQLARPFEPGRSAVVFAGDRMAGIIGEYKTSVKKAFKLPEYSAGFEVFLSQFEQNIQNSGRYQPLPRFPKLTQDITLRADAAVTYQQVYDAVFNSLPDPETEYLKISLIPQDIYQPADNKTYKHFTLRLSVASYDRTLTDAEVSSMLDSAARAAKASLGADRI